MQYRIVTFTLCFAFLFLTGCSQQTLETQKIYESGNVFTSIPEMTGREEIQKGRLNSSMVISGIYHSIILSGNIFIYSGVFTITIPQYLEDREYVSSYDVISKTMSEWIGFTNQNKQKASTFHLRKLVRPQSTNTAKSLCTKEYMDGVVSQSYTTIDTQGRTLYINYALLDISGLDVESRRAEEMHVCFVDSGMLYTFSLSNYTKAYMESIVHSLTFY